MHLEGKVAIVTGAARGIGYAIAKRFLMDGASVVLSDINHSAVISAAKDLQQFGNVLHMTTDVGDKLDIHNLLTYAITNLGEIDIFVNNAGIMHQADFLELKEEDFDRVLRINLKGAFLCSQAVAKRMVNRVEAGGDAGTIINISSITPLPDQADQLAYVVSKGGLDQLTQSLAVALTQWGIRVNAIGCGSGETNMSAALSHDTESRQRLLAEIPANHIGQPDEIAAIASYIASSDANLVTGQTIYADSGRPPLNQ